VESETRVRLSLIARCAGVPALVLAGVVVLRWLVNLTMYEPVVSLIGADAYFLIFEALWWLKVVASVLLVGALVAGWWEGSRAWAPGVTLLWTGMLLHWTWWFVSRSWDIWGFSRLPMDDPGADLDRQVQWLASLDLATSALVDLIAILLLVLGARRLLGAARSAKVADSPA